MSGAVRVRRARVLAAATAALVTGTAVVGAVLGVGGPTSPSAYAATPSSAVNGASDGTGAAALAGATGPTPELATSPDGVERPAPGVPAGSGEGRRVVFDMSDQRVWLVREDGGVARTYLVSGSVYDNLDPGSYEVYSRSEQAWAFDGSGSMRWMVRFTQGDNAAIGFHDIPLDPQGRKVQSRAELGTAQSHGCIRQWPDDAKALWAFAPVGTPVVVTA